MHPNLVFQAKFELVNTFIYTCISTFEGLWVYNLQNIDGSLTGSISLDQINDKAAL